MEPAIQKGYGEEWNYKNYQVLDKSRNILPKKVDKSSTITNK